LAIAINHQTREELMMSVRTIHVTGQDLVRLQQIIEYMRPQSPRDSENLRRLRQALEIADVKNPADIPRDVITMNSRVTVRDMDTGEQSVYTLVYPEKADYREGRISVLAPIGSAMLGYRAGDVVEWEVPKGTKRIRIEEIHYQPEANGDFNL
jgi:regulator of nucleoside diphosphate kinase